MRYGGLSGVSRALQRVLQGCSREFHILKDCIGTPRDVQGRCMGVPENMKSILGVLRDISDGFRSITESFRSAARVFNVMHKRSSGFRSVP